MKSFIQFLSLLPKFPNLCVWQQKSWFFNKELVQVSLDWLLLPPVVEDGVLLGHLPLLVLQIVPAENGQSDDQCCGYGQKHNKERAEIVCKKAKNMYVGQI